MIEFKFEDFKLHNSPSCSAEYVQIFNGAIDQSEIFEKTCGSHSNIPTLRSLGPVATVIFQAGQTTSSGFKLTYTTIDNPESCGGDLTDNSGTIMSPGFPNGYDHNMECLWKIMVKENENIIWRFEEISIEVSTHCFDYIAVGYGLDNSGSELGLLTEYFCGFYVADPENDSICDKQTICEPLPLPIYSLGNEMVIKFMSDFAGNPGRGFKGWFQNLFRENYLRHLFSFTKNLKPSKEITQLDAAEVMINLVSCHHQTIQMQSVLQRIVHILLQLVYTKRLTCISTHLILEVNSVMAHGLLYLTDHQQTQKRLFLKTAEILHQMIYVQLQTQ